jgi:glycosyltransferase involved in cell wall biosynthesis
MTVGPVVAAIPREIPGVHTVDVVVVDDGSTDRTASVAAEAGALVIRHSQTCGVGAAFQTALKEAVRHAVDLLVTIDADGQFAPADIPKLVAPVLAGSADLATASRFVDPALTPQMPWIKRWGNRQMSRLISHLTGSRFHDVSCGMRCYGRRALLSLNLLGSFTYTQEVFLNLALKRMRIVEVPVTVRGTRQYGQSRVANSIWRYALNTSLIIFRAYRDYRPLSFFGRIAIGLMVPAGVLSAFLMSHYFRTGSFSPHKWAGFTAAILFILGLLMLHMGVIGDMLNRQRVYLEELLYHQRVRRTPSHGTKFEDDPVRSENP